MTYSITGLAREPFEALFALDDAALAERGARRVTATSNPGYPCRISLEDAEPGERLILLHHVSHDVEGPFRSAYAIYVREIATASRYVDAVPPVFATRTLSLRGFDGEGQLTDAAIAQPGEADCAIRAMLDNPAIAYIDVHNAAPGCFAARVERNAS